ncbi:MAG: AmmeMemoRadiSam system protein B [Desulfatiglandales bacterium]
MPVRKSDFAGSWYPGKASDCLQIIAEFESEGVPCPGKDTKWLGGIVPHAGWFYSGRIACNVIKCLGQASHPDTIAIFGRHLRPGSRNYIMKEGQWDTPLGPLSIDQDLGEALASKFDFHVESALDYEQDNTIEVQLPFVKHFFPNSMILPLGVPPVTASLKIGEKLVELAETMGRNILVLGSTDLTHYGYNYGFTPKGVGREAVDWVKKHNDRSVVDHMLKMNAEEVIKESIKNGNACCSGAAATAIAGAKRLGASRGYELIYATSYDITPDSSFVGYVGIVFS